MSDRKMLDRKKLFSVALASVCVALPVARVVAGPSFFSTLVGTAVVGAEEEDEKKVQGRHDEHDQEKDDDEEHEKKEQKEIEQAVPMEMVPSAILDAVKKEVPNGTITEAELVAKHHKIVYSFDVKAGDMAYDVAISVEGKFISKKVDDDADEKDEKDEKKPEMAMKK